MTLDDSAMHNPSVAHALAHSLTTSIDREILEQLSTPEVGLIGFQCLIGVIFFSLFFLPFSFFFFKLFFLRTACCFSVCATFR